MALPSPLAPNIDPLYADTLAAPARAGEEALVDEKNKKNRGRRGRRRRCRRRRARHVMSAGAPPTGERGPAHPTHSLPPASSARAPALPAPRCPRPLVPALSRGLPAFPHAFRPSRAGRRAALCPRSPAWMPGTSS